MEYGDFVVDSANQQLVVRLDKLQEKALRLAEYRSNVKKKEMSILKSDFNIEDLEIRRKRSLLRLMYIQSKVDGNLQSKGSYMNLRSSNKVKMKSNFTKLTKIQRSPYYRGLKLWDQLPENVQKEQSKLVFKSKVSICIK